jgi:hypothetical protein
MPGAIPISICVARARNLYLSIEHRAAPGIDSLQLTLKVNPPALALREQISSIERTRAERLERAPDTGPQAMVRLLARVIGIGIETADMLGRLPPLAGPPLFARGRRGIGALKKDFSGPCVFAMRIKERNSG